MRLEIRKASSSEQERAEKILEEMLKIFNEKLTKEEINDFNLPINIILRFTASFFSHFKKDLEDQKKFSFQFAAGLIKVFEGLEKNGN